MGKKKDRRTTETARNRIDEPGLEKPEEIAEKQEPRPKVKKRLVNGLFWI
jgi:hypothetical protein